MRAQSTIAYLFHPKGDSLELAKIKSFARNWIPPAKQQSQQCATWLRKHPWLVWMVIGLLLILGSAKTVWRVSSSRYARSFLLKQQSEAFKFQKLGYPRVGIRGDMLLENTILIHTGKHARVEGDFPSLRGKIDLARFRKGFTHVNSLHMSRPMILVEPSPAKQEIPGFAPLALLAAPANFEAMNLPFDSMSTLVVENAEIQISTSQGKLRLRGVDFTQRYRKKLTRAISFQEVRSPGFPLLRKGRISLEFALDTLRVEPFSCNLHGGSVSGSAKCWNLQRAERSSPAAALRGKIKGCRLEKILRNTPLAGKMNGRIYGKVRAKATDFRGWTPMEIGFDGNLRSFRIEKLPVLNDLEALFGEPRFRSVGFKTLRIVATKRSRKIEFAELQGRGGFFNFDFTGSIRLKDAYAAGNLTIFFADSTYDSMKPSLAKMLFTRSEKGYSLEIPYHGTWDRPDLSQLAMKKGLKQLGAAIWNNLFE